MPLVQNVDGVNVQLHKMLKRGLVHLYYGDGKGKTSAALGVALRAIGHGMRVLIIQLMKGREWTGEYKVQELLENLSIEQYGTPSFINLYTPESKDRERALDGLKRARKAMNNNEVDLIIIDEALYAVEFGLVPLNELIDFIKNKPKNIELILTGGRQPPIELIDLADYVSHIVMEKHPYMEGILARRGIDY